MLNGYDISNNQGDINNGLVPSDFVIIKATEGVGYTDPNCDANYQQAKAAGKKLGVYHFARPDGNGPVSEANWFVSQIQGYLGEAVLVLDIEVQPITPQWVKSFADRVYELSKVRLWVYTSQSVFNTGDWSSVWPDYAAWVACYGMNNPQNGYGPAMAPVSINGNWTIVAWQYTSQGHLPNWGGNLDLDVAWVDAAGWDKYAKGNRDQPQPTPAPVVPAPEPTPQPTPVVTPPEPVQAPVTPEPVNTPTPVLPPVVAPVNTVKKETIMDKIVSELESNKTILVNIVVTFFQTAGAAWAVTNFSLDKLTVAGAIGAGLSAVWNIVLKPAFKAALK